MESNYKSTLRAKNLAEDLLKEELNLLEERVNCIEKMIQPLQFNYSFFIICIHAIARPQVNGFESLFIIFFSIFSAPVVISKILNLKIKTINKRIYDFWFFIEKVDDVIGKMDYYTKNVVEEIEKEIQIMYPEREVSNLKKEKTFQLFIHLLLILIISVIFISNKIHLEKPLIASVSAIYYLFCSGIFASTFLTFRNLNRI